MPAKKSTKKTPLSSKKKNFLDSSFLIMVVLVALAGIAFVVYASAATYSSVVG
jgi:hypothetical protein